MSRRIECWECKSIFYEEWIDHEFEAYRCPVCGVEDCMYELKTGKHVYFPEDD